MAGVAGIARCSLDVRRGKVLWSDTEVEVGGETERARSSVIPAHQLHGPALAVPNRCIRETAGADGPATGIKNAYLDDGVRLQLRFLRQTEPIEADSEPPRRVQLQVVRVCHVQPKRWNRGLMPIGPGKIGALL